MILAGIITIKLNCTQFIYFHCLFTVGYVPLGDITYPAHGDPPAILYETYRCIKRAFVYECEWGSDIWTDHGSGADSDLRVGVYCGLYISIYTMQYDF